MSAGLQAEAWPGVFGLPFCPYSVYLCSLRVHLCALKAHACFLLYSSDIPMRSFDVVTRWCRGQQHGSGLNLDLRFCRLALEPFYFYFVNVFVKCKNVQTEASVQNKTCCSLNTTHISSIRPAEDESAFRCDGSSTADLPSCL